jgi:hypothetical protein
LRRSRAETDASARNGISRHFPRAMRHDSMARKEREGQP